MDTLLQPPRSAVAVRPETSPEAGLNASLSSPSREREAGVLPPSNGLPSAARAAELMNAQATMPDVVARAQMSIALQQTVGNTRMGAMLGTVPEPQPPPPAESLTVAPARPAPAASPTTAQQTAKATTAPQVAPTPQPAAKPETATAPLTVPVVAPAPRLTPTTTPTPTTAPSATRAASEKPATVMPAMPAPVVVASKVPVMPPMAEPSPSVATRETPAKKAEAGATAKAGGVAAAEAPAEAAKPAREVSPTKRGAAIKPVAAGGEKAAAGGAPSGAAEAAVEEGGATGQGKAGGARAVTLKMPEPPKDVTPAARQRIQKAKSSAGKAAVSHASLPPATAAVKQARSAVTEPQEEVNARAEANLVAALGERPKPSPQIEELCKNIENAIHSKQPPDENSLVKSDPEKVAQAAGNTIKENVQGDVQGVNQSYDALDQKPAGAPQQQGQPLESPPVGAPVPAINASQATPDPVPEKNVSLDEDVKDSKAQMDEAGVNTEPAKLVKSGPVAEAHAAQGELEQTAKEDPAKVLAAQQAELGKASADMAALQQQALDALAASRRVTVSGTTGQQKKMVGSEEQTRARVSAQAQSIFTNAQTQVNNLLKSLPATPMKKWDEGVKVASLEFKQQLSVVEGWIKKRHAGGWGAVVGFFDEKFGLPSWITDEYNKAEEKFGKDICKLAREISTEVNGIIMACEAIIADARTQIANLFASLPASLQEWAAGEQAKLGSQLDSLQNHAHEVRDNFNRDLVDRASHSVQEVREQIHALREKAKGLLGRLADALERFAKDPAKFILEGLLELLNIPPASFWAVVAKIKKAIKDIADDPEKFANNLMEAVGKGFTQFFDNIGSHLLHGFLDWLTGGLAGAGVTLPKDLSLKSIITFILELMGITWPRIRKLLAKHIGEENVALLEKAYSIVANLVALGPEGVFEMIKEKLNPQEILDQIIQAAVDYITTAVIKAVSVRILLLFNPVGAILQALEAIYKVLKWIFTNAARIFALIETIVNGIADIIAGNIGGMANAVEKALAGLIPPVIAFLADYLGFGDLPEKVKETIIGFQNWVEGILDKVIGWLVEKGKALLGIGGKDEKDKKPKPGQIGKAVSWTAAGESHKMWIVKVGADASVMMSSTEKPVSEQLDEYQKIAEGLQPDKRAPAISLISQARQLLTGVDSTADEMAKTASNPEKSAESAPKQEQEVESGEDKLVGVLKQIREALGLSSNEIKLKTVFSMAGTGHNLYFEAKRPDIPKVEMATGRRGYLEMMVKSAIVREEAREDKRQELLTPLKAIEKELENIKWNWEANQGKSEEEQKARQEYLNTLERISVVLNSIGAEFKIPDLEHLGHASKYAQKEAIGGQPKLKPDYQGGANIRKTFYGGSYRPSTYDWKTKRLATLIVGAPPGYFFDEMTGGAEPINVPNLVTNVTIDHMNPKLVEHWNSIGHDDIQPNRLDFFNETSNMRLVAHKNNSTDGGKTKEEFQDEVGPRFRGPKDNP